MAKILPANAEDRSDPWSRKIPRATEQLSPCTTPIELRAVWQLLKPAGPETVLLHDRGGAAVRRPQTTAREQPRSHAAPAQPKTKTNKTI